MAQEFKIPEISQSDLSLIKDNFLTGQQLQFILSATEDKYKKQREGKGGNTYLYVSGGYVRKVLNLMFGWDWDFEVISWSIEKSSDNSNAYVLVHGCLTVRSHGKKLVKHQFGGKEVMFENDYSKDPNNPQKKIKKKSQRYLDLGNDVKAAATDCLKKCAAEIGIAADVYNKQEFLEVNIILDDEKDFNVSQSEFYEKENTEQKEGQSLQNLEEKSVEPTLIKPKDNFGLGHLNNLQL